MHMMMERGVAQGGAAPTALKQGDAEDACVRTPSAYFPNSYRLNILERDTMEYRRFGNKIVARMDRGEEILEQVKTIALAEDIRLASVSALGATWDFTVGVFSPEEKVYHPCSFKGDYEITALIGTINTMDGEFYTHLHMTAAGYGGTTVGGHLNRAVVSMTCEMVIDIIDGTVDREFDPELGFNRMKF